MVPCQTRLIEMALPSDYFDAGFPGASLPVRIASLHDARVFARRWVIRDKEPALKLLLRHLEKANSSATADIAVRQLKQALAHRGMLISATPLLSSAPLSR
jgi:hypothetical protein